MKREFGSFVVVVAAAGAAIYCRRTPLISALSSPLHSTTPLHSQLAILIQHLRLSPLLIWLSRLRAPSVKTTNECPQQRSSPGSEIAAHSPRSPVAARPSLSRTQYEYSYTRIADIRDVYTLYTRTYIRVTRTHSIVYSQRSASAFVLAKVRVPYRASGHSPC